MIKKKRVQVFIWGDVVKYNRLNGPEWEGFPILWGSVSYTEN